MGVGLSVAVILTSHLFYLHLDLWFWNSNIVVFIRVTDPGRYLTDTDPADEKKTDPSSDEILHI